MHSAPRHAAEASSVALGYSPDGFACAERGSWSFVRNAVTVGAIIVLAILLVVSFLVTNSHLANTLVFVGGAAVVIVARALRGRSRR